MEKFLEYSALISLFIGTILTSYNIYPIYIFFGLFTCFLWILVGIYWKKNTLIISQVLLLLINFSGLIKYFLTM